MKKLNKTKIIGSYIAIALIFFFFGYLFGHKNLVLEENFTPKIVNKELKKPASVDFSLFWQTWEKIEGQYVESVDPKQMVYGAIDGMVRSLNDPFSDFMTPEETKEFMQDLSGEFEGIGAELSKSEGKLIVISPLEGSPAKSAGLRPKDEIVKINDEFSADMDLTTAVSKIRGKAGTTVKLGIQRGLEQLDIEIKRAKITVKSVELKYFDKTAYLKISQFGDDTLRLAKQFADEIKSSKAENIVLDLRGNPGGYLDTSIEVASLFIEEGKVVVKEKNREGQVKEDFAQGDAILKDYKMVVLVDEGSASASEILAGALRDQKGVKLVGQKTFGKGSVQNLENLRGGSNLRITTAYWYTPNDQLIHKIGIEPDIAVEIKKEDYENEKDPQLEKALEMARN